MSDYKTVAPIAGQPAQPLPTPDDLLVHSEKAGVLIPLAQNMAGGFLGVGGFTGLFSFYILRETISVATVDGLIIGAFAFSIMTAIRMFRDEVRFMLAALGERQDKAARAALSKEVDDLRRLVKQLQGKGAISDAMVALLVARKLIYQAYVQKQAIDRESCTARGMSRPTWEAGNKVLRAARVVDGRSRLLLSTEIEAWAAVMKSQDGGMGHYDVTPDGDIVKTIS